MSTTLRQGFVRQGRIFFIGLGIQIIKVRIFFIVFINMAIGQKDDFLHLLKMRNKFW